MSSTPPKTDAEKLARYEKKLADNLAEIQQLLKVRNFRWMARVLLMASSNAAKCADKSGQP